MIKDCVYMHNCKEINSKDCNKDCFGYWDYESYKNEKSQSFFVLFTKLI